MISEILHKIGFDWQLALSHTVNFLIIFFLLVKFALPKLKKTIDERKAKIEEGLTRFTASAQMVKDAELKSDSIIKLAEEEKKSILAKGEAQHKEIIKEASAEKVNIIAIAKEEGEKIKRESFDKGVSEISDKIGDILETISKKAFDGKVSVEANDAFVQKVFSESYGK